MEWWLICEGVKEIELVRTGVWMLLAPKDGAKLHRSRIKGDNLWKLSTLVTLCFYFCSSSLELKWFFTMDDIREKCPRCKVLSWPQIFNLSLV